MFDQFKAPVLYFSDFFLSELSHSMLKTRRTANGVRKMELKKTSLADIFCLF